VYGGPTDPQQQQQGSTQPVANGAIYLVGGEPQQQQGSTQPVANGAIYMVGGEPQQQQGSTQPVANGVVHMVGNDGTAANAGSNNTSIYAVPMEEPLHDPTYSGYTAPDQTGGAGATAAALVYAQPVDDAAGADGANTINRPTDSNNVYDPWGVSPATTNTSTTAAAAAATEEPQYVARDAMGNAAAMYDVAPTNDGGHVPTIEGAANTNNVFYPSADQPIATAMVADYREPTSNVAYYGTVPAATSLGNAVYGATLGDGGGGGGYQPPAVAAATSVGGMQHLIGHTEL
jgi:hypothetical protein